MHGRIDDLLIIKAKRMCTKVRCEFRGGSLRSIPEMKFRYIVLLHYALLFGFAFINDDWHVPITRI